MRIAVVPTAEIRERTFLTIGEARGASAPPSAGMSVVIVVDEHDEFDTYRTITLTQARAGTDADE